MRLDAYIADKFSFSRTKAKQMICQNFVLVNGCISDKPAQSVSGADNVELVGEFAYASLGGDKLAKALDDFACNVGGKICADVGASNGGFTDCLLKNGAARVYAVDVGECAFEDKLKADPRVYVVDKTNARYLTEQSLPETCDFACIDVSFISLRLVLPSVIRTIRAGGEIIALIKPQFEVGRKFLSKRGIVTDLKRRENAVRDLVGFCKEEALEVVGLTTAPIKAEKNVEYLIYLRKPIE